MLAVQAVACLVGLLLLARAADVLVLGSSRLAGRLGVPSVVVGVVVIGFGTSAPEILVSGLAALSGAPAIGVGNAIGSNIANLSLVLGTAALVAPISVHAGVIRREVPMTVLATLVFGLAVQDGVTRGEAVAMFGLLAGSLGLLLRWSLRDQGDRTDQGNRTDREMPVDEAQGLLTRQETRSVPWLTAETAMGLLGTLAGGQLLVWGAVGLSHGLGLSEGFVGVSIVALGTSLPELVTAAQASRRGESDLIVGNLLGSNLFNALAVGGLIGLLRPGVAVGRPLALTGVLVMIGVSVLALGFMVRGFRVLRWEAAVLVVVFVVCLPLMVGG